VENGGEATKEAFDLQRLLEAIQKADESGLFDGLGEWMGKIFGGGPGAGVEGEALQTLLNDLNTGGYPPVDVDNRIGPETTVAFIQALRENDPERLVRRFGKARADAVRVRAYTQNRSGHAVAVAEHQRSAPRHGVA
jgi:hypothetical protein